MQLSVMITCLKRRRGDLRKIKRQAKRDLQRPESNPDPWSCKKARLALMPMIEPSLHSACWGTKQYSYKTLKPLQFFMMYTSGAASRPEHER